MRKSHDCHAEMHRAPARRAARRASPRERVERRQRVGLGHDAWGNGERVCAGRRRSLGRMHALRAAGRSYRGRPHPTTPLEHAVSAAERSPSR